MNGKSIFTRAIFCGRSGFLRDTEWKDKCGIVVGTTLYFAYTLVDETEQVNKYGQEKKIQ